MEKSRNKPGPRPKQQAEKRSYRITICLTEAEYQLAKRFAEMRKMKLATFARRKLLK